jgi:tetratricopeptide (TPR) repeat protein
LIAILQEGMVSSDDPQKPGARNENDLETATDVDLEQIFLRAAEDGDAAAIERVAKFILNRVSKIGKTEEPLLVYGMEARRREAEGDWPGAEAAYRKILSASDKPLDPDRAPSAHAGLSQLYAFLGNDAGALREAEIALEIARCQENTIILVQALARVSECRIRTGAVEGALAAAEEMMQCVPDGKVYECLRGSALIHRAACSLRASDVERAEHDLEDAWKLICLFENAAVLSGAQAVLAGWWALTADICLQRGDCLRAVSARRRQVEYTRRMVTAPLMDGPYIRVVLADALHQLGEALIAAGDPLRANEAFAEEQSIRHVLMQPERRAPLDGGP